MVCLTDIYYAVDPDSRRSVSEYIIYMHGVTVCWKSKAQCSITLSSTNTEWVALSETVKEIIFVLSLCESINIRIQLPVMVRVDNSDAIFMFNNITITATFRTKHVDEGMKFVVE